MQYPSIVGIGFLSTWAIGLVTPAFCDPPACTPGAAGRFDVFADGDVDLDDYAALVECFAGPGMEPESPAPIEPARCLEAFDVDGDGGVDLADVRLFLLQYTGACEGIHDCPDGWHLVHRSGVIGVPDPDTFESADAIPSDYRCVRDGSCTGVVCSSHGTCRVEAGNAVCACARGYAGAECERCAVGYERTDEENCTLGRECRERLCSGQGTCRDTGLDIACDCDRDTSGQFCEEGGGDVNVPRPPTRVIVTGTEASIPAGTCVELTARGLGGGAIATDFQWSLTGPGTLAGTTGNKVLYCAPTSGFAGETRMARIDICTGLFPDDCATRYLTIDPPGGIPAAGESHIVFKPVDDAVLTFMRQRCVGAAVLGISLYGKVVHLRGFGNLAGAPTNDPDYLESCCDTWDICGHVPGFALPEPTPVQPNTPMRIGSISKPVTAAVLRKIVKEQVFGGANATDDDVEDALLCLTDLDLIPVDVRNILCFGVPGPPVPLPSSGDDDTSCPNLALQADTRWQNVTLGHLLGHAVGMPKSAPDTAAVTVPNLASIRDLFGQSNFEAEEIALTSQLGFPSGHFLIEFSDYLNARNAIEPGYFLPRPTSFEVLKVVLGRCLEFAPGSSTKYSNTSYVILPAIIEHLTGGPYAGRSGRPGLHSGSALHTFLIEDLGFPFPGQQSPGIFYSQDVFRLRDLAEPIYRTWSVPQQTYYKLVADNKRPHCRWTGNSCDFSEWLDGDLRFDWDFHEEQTILGYDESPGDSIGGTGGLATEAEALLRFMANYWIEGKHKSNPTYGETRCPGGNCIWTLGRSHNGSRDGTYAEAWQLGGQQKTSATCTDHPDCGNYTVCKDTPEANVQSETCLGGLCRRLNQYSIPPLDGAGKITDDFANLECHGCAFPVGVDFFVAVNQSTDCKCRLAETLYDDHPRKYSCSNAYSRIRAYVLHGICQIDFPANPYQIWPIVFEGGSSMSGLLTQPETELNAALTVPDLPYQYRGPDAIEVGNACCGNDVKDPGEACDGTDLGSQTCADFGHTMGTLRCTPVCTIDSSDCTGGMGGPPASYGDCGFDDCRDPSDPNCTLDGDAGRCLGGPCHQTDPGDFEMALFDPLNQSGGMFHPDGNFRDNANDNNLFFCYDDTGAGEMVCINENGWGVCKQCATASEFSTRIGCTCNTVSDCDLADPGLNCFGEEFGGGPGFCYDAHDGPPPWQCAEGTCGMTTYPQDAMYCEHYSLSGPARCEPWFACNSILARVCAGEDLICAMNAGSCTGEQCCGPECMVNSDCGQQNGWPAGFTCSPQEECVGP